jgi:hypothetical protein
MRLFAPVRRSTFLVLLGAALVSVALTTGVAVRGPTAASAPEPTSSVSAAPPPAGTFQAVAGPACPVDGTRNVRISTGWRVVPGDSWTGDGCGDRFLYSAPADANSMRWLFTFGGDGAVDCRVSVFVPDSPLSSDLVWYGIGDRSDNADYRIGGFTVDQKAGRGSWVDGATVPVGTGALMVNVDGRQNLTGITAAPLKVSCG